MITGKVWWTCRNSWYWWHVEVCGWPYFRIYRISPHGHCGHSFNSHASLARGKENARLAATLIVQTHKRGPSSISIPDTPTCLRRSVCQPTSINICQNHSNYQVPNLFRRVQHFPPQGYIFFNTPSALQHQVNSTGTLLYSPRCHNSLGLTW
jgi:hypothetical protein